MAKQIVGLESYDSKRKESHRGWVWNRIAERTAVPVGECVVAYFPGPNDIDRGIALKKGFKNKNLIAVDLCEKNIENVRKTGGVGICSRMEEFIVMYNEPLNAIYLDTCSGLSFVSDFIKLREYSTCLQAGAVICYNLLRGRESKQSRLIGRDSFGDTKHRGLQALSLECSKWDYSTHELSLSEKPAGLINDTANPRIASYRSGKALMMDSVVFNLPHISLAYSLRESFSSRKKFPERYAFSLKCANLLVSGCRQVKHRNLEAVFAKIAALKAVRSKLP